MKKIKKKTRKSVASKFKVTGTGKLIRKSPGFRHHLTKKSSKRKHKLSKDMVVDKAHTKTYAMLMGVN